MTPGDSLPDPIGGGSSDSPRSGCLGHLGIALALAVGIFGVLLGAVLGWFAHQPEPAPAASVRTTRSNPSVVVAVRELARLEGAEFHIERVIELTETQRRLFGLVEAEDAILLVASGQVVAGVDLSKLTEEDVTIDPAGRRVVLRLPPARVFHSRLDNEKTYVHTRKTDVLARRAESLETDARREAERTLADAARESDILRVAEGSIERTVSGLVRALGYRDVSVSFGPASESPPGMREEGSSRVPVRH